MVVKALPRYRPQLDVKAKTSAVHRFAILAQHRLGMRVGVALVAKDALISEAVEALSQITSTMLNHRNQLTIKA